MTLTERPAVPGVTVRVSTDRDLRSVALPASLVVLVVVVVHAAGLRSAVGSLVGGLDITSPLIYVPFVPFVSAMIVAGRWRPHPGEPARVATRAADALAAGALFAAAAVVAWGLPRVFGTETLAWRADLASLAPFTAAVVVAILGVRMLWRLRAPIFLLTFMSPALYRPVISPVRSSAIWLTDRFVFRIAGLLPMVHRVRGGDDGPVTSIFHNGDEVTVVFGQACAGIGSLMAGAFVAIVVSTLTTGSRRRKLLWSVGLVALCWIGNLVRIVLLVVGVSWYGVGVATGTFHMVIGLVVLALTLTIGLLLASRLGLRPVKRLERVETNSGVRRCGILPVLLVAAVAVPAHHLADGAARDFDLLHGPSRVAQTSAVGVFDLAAISPPEPGVVVDKLPSVAWAAQYYGFGATWNRYLLLDRKESRPIAIDVISAGNASRFDDRTLASCFGFHDWQIRQQRLITLAGGHRAEWIVHRIHTRKGAAAAGISADRDRTTAVLSWRQETTAGTIEQVTLQMQVDSVDVTPVTLTATADRLVALIAAS